VGGASGDPGGLKGQDEETKIELNSLSIWFFVEEER